MRKLHRRCCPQKAISPSARGNVIDRQACILCGVCKEKCTYGAIEIYGEQKTVSEVMEPLYKGYGVFHALAGRRYGERRRTDVTQADFVNAVMRECKNECLYTALETCGLATWGKYVEVLNIAMKYCFDIKTLIPQQFAEIVAGGIDMKANALEMVKTMCANCAGLAKSGVPVRDYSGL